jgi:hypothetical protein
LTFIAEVEVVTFRIMQYIRVQQWVSKNAEFYEDFKNIKLP